MERYIEMRSRGRKGKEKSTPGNLSSWETGRHRYRTGHGGMGTGEKISRPGGTGHHGSNPFNVEAHHVRHY